MALSTTKKIVGFGVRLFYRDYVPNLRNEARTLSGQVSVGEKLSVRDYRVINGAGQTLVENRFLADYLVSKGKREFEVTEQMLTIKGMSGFLREGKYDLLKSPALCIPASLGVLDLALKASVASGFEFHSSVVSTDRYLNFGNIISNHGPFYIYFSHSIGLLTAWTLYNFAQKFTSKLAAGIFVAAYAFKMGERIFHGAIFDYIKVHTEQLGLGFAWPSFDLNDAVQTIGLPLAAFAILRFGYNMIRKAF